MAAERIIRVEALTRVEGEGRIWLGFGADGAARARLSIFEPPRYFEALLVGRDFREAPDITARICGICPVAYQMSACHALEAARGVAVPAGIRDLRRLLYCGEWIASHALHVSMLHLPDLLDCDDVFEAATRRPALVQRLLRLREIGNLLLGGLGGREVHPVNVRPGGFWRLPRAADLATWRDALAEGLGLAVAAAEECATLEFDRLEGDWRFGAMVHPDEYPMNEGRLCLEGAPPWPVEEYERHLHAKHLDYTTALRYEDGAGRPVLMGPLARFALNREKLTPEADRLAGSLGLGPACRRPSLGLLVRLVEVALACEEGVALCAPERLPDAAAVDVPAGPGRGAWATEAPRGTLWHEYVLGDHGRIERARIVAPTAVNQAAIEADVGRTADAARDARDEALARACQRAVRCHDPCISCATHVLGVTIEPGGRR